MSPPFLRDTHRDWSFCPSGFPGVPVVRSHHCRNDQAPRIRSHRGPCTRMGSNKKRRRSAPKPRCTALGHARRHSAPADSDRTQGRDRHSCHRRRSQEDCVCRRKRRRAREHAGFQRQTTNRQQQTAVAMRDDGPRARASGA